MKRVPAKLALLALHQSGEKITPATLRKWVQRGHITRGLGGYDLAEILAYLDRRATPADRVERVCQIDDCEQPHVAHGLCVKHYRRQHRHGDPQHEPDRTDEIGYAAVHKRLRSQLGNARQHQCPCGQPAAHWAYDHGDPNERIDVRNGPYSTDPNHYQPLCATCHGRFDAPHRVA